jgi:hypothetical protein
VKRKFIGAAILSIAVACARLQPLTAEALTHAENKWRTRGPESYRIVIEMSGDRVQNGRFEVTVRDGLVIELKRNGLVIPPTAGQDYSMAGLFHMLEQEIGLAERPATLGAPEGYSVYLNARFDEMTGRLIRYRRVVGGTSNSIEVNVVEFKTNDN